MTTKEQIAEALEEIATLLELKEENPFKIRAYQNAARSIEAFGASFADLQNQEALERSPASEKRSRRKSVNWQARAGSNFSTNCARNFRPPFWNCFPFRGWARKKSRRSTSS